MAQKITRYGRMDDTPTMGDSGVVLPALSAFINATKGDASTRHGGSILLFDETHAFRMLDVQTADGAPAEITVTVTISRTAANANEAERIAKAKAEQSGRADARKLKDANERQSALHVAVETYRKGIKDAASVVPASSTVDKVRESLELATTLLPMLQKSLPSGQ